MSIHRLWQPDISVIEKDEGNEVLIVEVKNEFPNSSSEEAIVLLRNYMSRFFTKIGLLVTPEQTLIMRKAYLDYKGESNQGYYSFFLSTDDLFEIQDMILEGHDFENYVYLKIVEMVDSINRETPIPMVSKIASNLEFLLENTQVVKRRV